MKQKNAISFCGVNQHVVFNRYLSARQACLCALVMVLLAGCKPAKLTEQECLAIQEKEIVQIASWSDAAQNSKWAAERMQAQAKICAAGERYTRKDYACYVAAKTNAQIAACANQVDQK
jgi:hypothetical protein